MTAHAPLRVLVCGALLAVLAGCNARPACLEQDAALATQAFEACALKGKHYPWECADAAERVSCTRRAEK